MSAPTPSAKNHLDETHYRAPGQWRQVMTTRQLRETLLYTGGDVMACGESWDVKGERLGAGVHRVTLERRTAPSLVKAPPEDGVPPPGARELPQQAGPLTKDDLELVRFYCRPELALDVADVVSIVAPLALRLVDEHVKLTADLHGERLEGGRLERNAEACAYRAAADIVRKRLDPHPDKARILQEIEALSFVASMGRA